MFGLNEISVEFLTASPLAVVLGLLLLIGLAVLAYLRTNPPLPLWRRVVLWTLRIIAVSILMLALSEPVVRFSREYQRPRRVAVLIDQSESMDRVEDGSSRRDRMDSLLSGGRFASVVSRAEVSTYFFGENLFSEPAKIIGNKTAIGDALRELEKKELSQKSDFWLLFSDGNSNTGRPASDVTSGLAVPVHTIDMAGQAEDFDISLADIDYNPVVFVGQSTRVKVKLAWHNVAGKDVPVTLSSESRLLAEGSVRVSDQGTFSEIDLAYVPTAPGQLLLKVQAGPSQGEINESNNSRTVAVKVLKSRLAVLLVSDRPDYEVGFLHRYLLRSQQTEVDLVVTGRKSGNLGKPFPPRQADLNRYDLVILHDPDPIRLEPYRTLLTSYLSDRGGGLWFLLGPSSNQPCPDWLKQILPFRPVGSGPILTGEFRATPSEGQLLHPVVRLADDRSAIRETWAELPPFRSLVVCKSDDEGVVLAYTSGLAVGEERLPVLGYRRVGPGKVLASAALPFWPWSFVNLGYGGDDRFYRAELDGITRWLTVREDFDPIRILPRQEVFSRGDAVTFEAHAFDPGFRPIAGVVGQVRLTGSDDVSMEIDFLPEGEGEYGAVFNNVQPGTYQYDAVLRRDGRLLKERSGQLLVEEFSLEEFDQSGNPALLQAVSTATGGTYYHYDQWADLIASLDLAPITEVQEGEFTFWGELWMLLAFVGALASEWILRKGSHLI